MENKYFTPDIEDIHVGYECEILKEAWEPFKFNVEDIIPVFAMVNSKTIVSDKIRVSYLTKEQIEAEGWEQRGKGNVGGVVYGYYNKNDSSICAWGDSTKIEIQEREGNILFYGECKDINTFRKICKLLAI
tara:strand:+ start:34535 stop:34927 length:393 start_codon:yes stop_codon:yes gene_type:complete